MLAVGLPEEEIAKYLEVCFATSQLTIACLNSPKNITVSGNEADIHTLQVALEKDNVFVRRLPGKIAYHSPQMNKVKEKYRLRIDCVVPGLPIYDSIVMFSSLTGSSVTVEKLYTPDYWVENMISQVKFTEAVGNITFRTKKKLSRALVQGKNKLVIDFVLEIGPHSVLKSALREMLVTKSDNVFKYCAVLVKSESALSTAIQCAGQLWCLGCPVRIDLVNSVGRVTQSSSDGDMLVNLTSYPFDHIKKYWLESRINKGYRLRPYPHHELLGTRCSDWNSLEARWRNWINIHDSPWTKEHIVCDMVRHGN
jgi:acyl transferase domain-containing protein